MALGQGAGTAARFCVQLNVEPRELPARFLQDKLPAQGLEISFLPDVTPATRHYGAIQFLAAQGFCADGPLQPEAPTTRAEAAQWLIRLLRLERGWKVTGAAPAPRSPASFSPGGRPARPRPRGRRCVWGRGPSRRCSPSRPDPLCGTPRGPGGCHGDSSRGVSPSSPSRSSRPTSTGPCLAQL